MNGTAAVPALARRALILPLGTLTLALVLAGVGALDTDAAGWGPRIGYWLLMTAVTVAGCFLTRFGVRRLLPAGSEAVTGALSAILAAGPLSVTALALCIGLFGGAFTLDRLQAVAPGVAVIVAIVQAGLALAYWRVAPDAQARRPGLEARLPLELSGAVVHALEAEDHYVRVHTDRGETLLRMRLAEAAALFPEEEGMRVHRSWWVRGEAVASVRRSARRAVITLTNGRDVPVSRSAGRALAGALARWRREADAETPP